MSGDAVTFDEVLSLARRLSPADQARLRAALPPVDDEAAARALQRLRNQAAIELLDAWLTDTSEHDDNVSHLNRLIAAQHWRDIK